MNQREKQLEAACWIAHQLFARKMGAGTTGNLSFVHEGALYITASGTCFGTLGPEDMATVRIDTGEILNGKPSKELALHLALSRRPGVGAVIHLHSPYSVLWSCLAHEDPTDCVPRYTPYLEMKVGKIGLVPYAPPGSSALACGLEQTWNKSDGWLLANHGMLVKASTLMDAFAAAEELEESCRIAWELQGNLRARKIPGETQ